MACAAHSGADPDACPRSCCAPGRLFAILFELRGVESTEPGSILIACSIFRALMLAAPIYLAAGLK
jgi:hypothetical protein